MHDPVHDTATPTLASCFDLVHCGPPLPVRLYSWQMNMSATAHISGETGNVPSDLILVLGRLVTQVQDLRGIARH